MGLSRSVPRHCPASASYHSFPLQRQLIPDAFPNRPFARKRRQCNVEHSDPEVRFDMQRRRDLASLSARRHQRRRHSCITHNSLPEPAPLRGAHQERTTASSSFGLRWRAGQRTRQRGRRAAAWVTPLVPRSDRSRNRNELDGSDKAHEPRSSRRTGHGRGTAAARCRHRIPTSAEDRQVLRLTLRRRTGLAAPGTAVLGW